jgi:hypothetical protein
MRNVPEFVIARAYINFPLGVPTIAAQDGGFAGLLVTGVGDITLQMPPGNGVGGGNTDVQITAAGLNLVGSDAPAFGVSFPPGGADIRVTTVQEQAAGAASIPADIEFMIRVSQYAPSL